MPDRIRDLTTNISTKWKALDIVQQRRLLMGAIGLIIALGVTIFLATRPDWIILEQGLTFTQSSQASQALTEAGIPHRVTANASAIEVRRQDHEVALLHLHTSEVFLDGPGFVLEDVLDQIGLATSEDTRTEMFRRAQEGEIARALTALEGIESADVTLNLIDNRLLFLREGQQASAAVILHTSRPIDNEMALMLAHLIANSVEGLSIENVVITDQHLRNIFNGAGIGADRFGGVNAEFDQRIQARAIMELAVRNLFRDAWDRVEVSANVEINMDTETTTARIFASPLETDRGIPTATDTLMEMATGTAMELPEPGMGVNVGLPIFGVGMPPGDFEAERALETTTYAVNETLIVTERATGTLVPENSSIAVVLMDEQIFSQSVLEEQGALEDTTWEAFRIENNVPVELEVPAGAAELISNATGIPLANVTVTAIGLPVFVDAQITPLNWYNIILFGILAALLGMLAYGLFKSRQPQLALEVEPELAVQDLLVTDRIDEVIEDERQSLQEIAYNIDSEVKQQIDKFVNEKPEAVAQLIRSWMNEGWE